MKLINDFYTILDAGTEGDVYRCKVRLNAQHGIYRVHFPENPITPGVCLLQMAAEIMGERYHKTFLLFKGSNIKFKRPVTPHDQPVFVFSKMVMENDRLSTNISIEDGGSPFVTMSLCYHIID